MANEHASRANGETLSGLPGRQEIQDEALKIESVLDAAMAFCSSGVSGELYQLLEIANGCARELCRRMDSVNAGSEQ